MASPPGCGRMAAVKIMVFLHGTAIMHAAAARRAGADLLVEDDCQSIGGVAQTTQASLAATPGRAVRCVLVPEFGGLAHLPGDPGQLAAIQQS